MDLIFNTEIIAQIPPDEKRRSGKVFGGFILFFLGLQPKRTKAGDMGENSCRIFTTSGAPSLHKRRILGYNHQVFFESLFSLRLNSDWDGDSVPFPGPSGPLFGEIVPPAQSPGPQSPHFPLRICLSRLRRSRAANPQGRHFCSRRSEGVFSS